VFAPLSDLFFAVADCFIFSTIKLENFLKKKYTVIEIPLNQING